VTPQSAAQAVTCTSQSTANRASRILRGAAFVLLGAWAAFWTYFAVGRALAQGGAAWSHAFELLIMVVGFPLLAWLAPRIGGVLLIAAGVMSGGYCASSATRALLALPAIALGVVVGGLGWRAWWVARSVRRGDGAGR
jgi:hypothetical protein